MIKCVIFLFSMSVFSVLSVQSFAAERYLSLTTGSFSPGNTASLDNNFKSTNID
jgi:hypothetical protein